MFHDLAGTGSVAEVLIDSYAVKAYRCASGGKGGDEFRRSATHAANAPQKTRR